MCCVGAGAPRSKYGSPPRMKMRWGGVPNPGLGQPRKKLQEVGQAKEGWGGQRRERGSGAGS